MIQRFFTFLRKNRLGATTIEYALVAAMISMAIVAVLNNMSPKMATPYNSANQAMGNVTR